MKLITDWKKAHKLTSVQIAIIIAVLAALQTYLPSFQEYIPPALYALISMCLGIAVVVGRVIKQGGDDADNPQ